MTVKATCKSLMVPNKCSLKTLGKWTNTLLVCGQCGKPVCLLNLDAHYKIHHVGFAHGQDQLLQTTKEKLLKELKKDQNAKSRKRKSKSSSEPKGKRRKLKQEPMEP